VTKVLYIGGTGEISYECVRQSVALGHDVAVFNRGVNPEPLPDGVRSIIGSVDDDEAYAALRDEGFDVVCQFLAYNVQRIERDIDVFGGAVKQYVFISSASAYQKPPLSHIITEQTPLENPFWPYSRAKADMEKRLFAAHASGTLPVTVVRPSHTIRRKFPGTFIPGDHMAWRITQSKPIVVHGDGQSLWTLTHASDFAVPFARLLGNDKALGEAFHITTDEANTWDRIIAAIGRTLGMEPRVVHVSTDALVKYNDAWSGPLVGDKACSVVFDNSKVKAAVGGWDAKISMPDAIHRAGEHVVQRLVELEPDVETDQLVDRIIADQEKLG